MLLTEISQSVPKITAMGCFDVDLSVVPKVFKVQNQYSISQRLIKDLISVLINFKM